MRRPSTVPERLNQPSPAVLAGPLGPMARQSRSLASALPKAVALLDQLDQLGGALARAARVRAFGVGTSELMISGRDAGGEGAASLAGRCAYLAAELEVAVPSAAPRRRRSVDSAIWRLERASQPSFLAARNARRSLRLVKSALSATRN
ncbi:MAG: hypothetical protein KJO07_25940, partial [Deltaproteobacteria bacterium]|nr:hypothetical protein [Deltaproteobacteria bacterium]